MEMSWQVRLGLFAVFCSVAGKIGRFAPASVVFSPGARSILARLTHLPGLFLISESANHLPITHSAVCICVRVALPRRFRFAMTRQILFTRAAGLRLWMESR